MVVDDTSVVERFWDLSPDMMCLADTEGYLRQVNASFTRTLGWSAEELQSKRFLEFVHPDDQEATMAEAARLARGEPTIHFENRYRCKDGSWKWLSWRCEPHDDELFAIARDVTELKTLQEQARERARVEASAQAMEEVARQQRLILNAASHELNTPLTPMVFDLAQLEARIPDDDEAQQALKSLQRNVRKLQTTITSLLHVSQLVTERLHIQPRPVPMFPIMQRASPDVEPACDKSLRVFGDEALMEHAVEALVRNAEQHGNGVEHIGAREDGDVVIVEVKDRGPGFEGDGTDWFLPLYRGDATQQMPGTGLGLTMVRLVATAHGGKAGVRSRGSGKGTTAWIAIPKA